MKRKSIFAAAVLFAPALFLAMPSPGMGGAPGGGAPRGGGAPGGGGGGGGGGMPAINRTRTYTDLVKPSTPTKAPDKDGFIQRWMILDPIAAQGVGQNEFQAVVKTQHFADELTMIPTDGQKVTAGNSQLEWHAIDTTEFKLNLYHFGPMINKPTDNIFFWVFTVVNSPEEMKDARLAIGSNDASIWWLNGEEVVGIYGDRPVTIDDGVSKRLTLKKGANVIRGAVHNRAGQTDFCARLLDKDEKPITNVTTSLSTDAK